MPKDKYKYPVNQKTELEKLAKYILEGKSFEASDALTERIVRAKFAYDQGAEIKNMKIKPHKVRQFIVQRLVDEFEVSMRMAYFIYEDAQKYFGFEDILSSAEFNYAVLIRELDDDMEACRQIGDYRSVSAMQKTKLEALKNRPKDLDSKIAEIPFATIYYDFEPSLINSKVLKSADELEQLDQKLRLIIQSGKAENVIKQEMLNTLDYAEYEDSVE